MSRCDGAVRFWSAFGFWCAGLPLLEKRELFCGGAGLVDLLGTMGWFAGFRLRGRAFLCRV